MLYVWDVYTIVQICNESICAFKNVLNMCKVYALTAACYKVHV